MTTFVAGGPAPSLHEHALLAAAQRGDQRAQEELLRRYEPLVRATVRRLRLPARVDGEDIAQEARVGLLAAIRRWSPERGSFAAFAARCVRNQAIKALNAAGAEKHKPLSCALSLHSAPIGMPEPDDQAGAPRDLDIPSRMAQPEATLLAREELRGRMRRVGGPHPQGARRTVRDAQWPLSPRAGRPVRRDSKGRLARSAARARQARAGRDTERRVEQTGKPRFLRRAPGIFRNRPASRTRRRSAARPSRPPRPMMRSCRAGLGSSE
jgi:RNA polymerase sigma factor (sigma-70 family)